MFSMTTRALRESNLGVRLIDRPPKDLKNFQGQFFSCFENKAIYITKNLFYLNSINLKPKGELLKF